MIPSVVEGDMPSWHAMDDAMSFPYCELAPMAILLERIASECRFGRFCHRMRTSCPFLYNNIHTVGAFSIDSSLLEARNQCCLFEKQFCLNIVNEFWHEAGLGVRP